VAFSWAWLFPSFATWSQRSHTMPVFNGTTTAEQLARAAAHLRQAALLIEEAAPGIVSGLVPGIIAALPQSLASVPSVTPSGKSSARHSIIDEATFSVRWANRTCYLGNTKPFRLMERLARRPDHLVLCETLLDELWDEQSSREVLRAAVKLLRRKLTSAGMEDLAKAIDGSTAHHYGLMPGLFTSNDSTASVFFWHPVVSSCYHVAMARFTFWYGGSDMMVLREVIERFEKRAPVCVMVRATMENVLSAERLDALFENAAGRQENKCLMFSTVADIMGLVACQIHPSVHAAYQAKKEEAAVTAKALYDKLQRMETNISRQVVRETASRMGEIIEKTGGILPEAVAGYRVKILDGNHLRRTQRRIKELRELNAAPLPGHCAVILDPQRKLIVDVIPCEDAHAQERTLLPQVLETVERRDLWIADRNDCTAAFLFGIRQRLAYFAIRQHAQLRHELLGKRQRIAESDTGTVYEQRMRVFDATGNWITVRRVTVELNTPTRDGEMEIHVLTNLPKRIGACCVADLYRKRWTIEIAFNELAQNLEGEIETLGYPRAALFGFCMALVCYNVLSVVLAALRAAHGAQTVQEQVSFYYLCDEVASTHRGLEIAVVERYWTRKYANLTPLRMARELVRIAKMAQISRYRKHRRGPKKPVVKMNKKHRSHVSTARILAKRLQYCT
jgi:hypothetical protein